MSDFCSLCGHTLEYELTCPECDGEDIKELESKHTALREELDRLIIMYEEEYKDVDHINSMKAKMILRELNDLKKLREMAG